MVRENNFVETYKSLKRNQKRLSEAEEASINKKVAAINEKRNNIADIVYNREQKRVDHQRLLEAARNDSLGIILKNIVIKSMDENTITDDGIILAEDTVDNWIKSKGGANKILTEAGDKTYLLAKIHQIVEAEAEKETKEAEDVPDAKDDDNDDVDPSADIQVDTDDMNGDDNASDNSSDTSTDDAKENDSKSDDKTEEKDTSEDSDKDETSTDDKSDDDNTTSDDTSDSGEDTSDENQDTDTDDNGVDDVDDALGSSVDSGSENTSDDAKAEENEDKDAFDELDKEEDVKKAVETIKARVADAEETFIKNNAEDKQKIDELLNKISDNVKTVKDMGDENADSGEAKVAKEHAMKYRQQINAITENRPLNVFEKMVRKFNKNIISDQVLKEQYCTEDGKLDVPMIVESSKVLYTFLETINTLQLEKVDANYIKEVIDSI